MTGKEWFPEAGFGMMIRRYQPGCLVNSRIGNGLGDYRSPQPLCLFGCQSSSFTI